MNGKWRRRTCRRPLVRTRRSGTEASRKAPIARPSQSLEAPAKITAPTRRGRHGAGDEPQRHPAVRSSPRLHQMRARLPKQHGDRQHRHRRPDAERPRRHRQQEDAGAEARHPPIVEPSSAVPIRIIHVRGSGMPCHHTPVIRWAAAAGAFVVSLDSTMNIAFPAIAAAFAVPPERVRWVIVCYVLVYALTSLAGGALADRVGHGRVFRVGLVLSVVAFVMGGMAPTFGWLLGARVVQGLGGGCVYGTAPGLVTLGVPRGAARSRPRLPRRGHGARPQRWARSSPACWSTPSAGARSFTCACPWRWRCWPGRGRDAGGAGGARAAAGGAARPGAPAGAPGRLAVVRRQRRDVRDLAAGPVLSGRPRAVSTPPSPGSSSCSRRSARRWRRRWPGGWPIALGAGRAGGVRPGAGSGGAGAPEPRRPGRRRCRWSRLALFAAGFGLGMFQVPNMAIVMAEFPASQQGAAGGFTFLARTLGVVVGVLGLAHLFAARRLVVGLAPAAAEAFLAAGRHGRGRPPSWRRRRAAAPGEASALYCAPMRLLSPLGDRARQPSAAEPSPPEPARPAHRRARQLQAERRRPAGAGGRVARRRARRARRSGAGPSPAPRGRPRCWTRSRRRPTSSSPEPPTEGRARRGVSTTPRRLEGRGVPSVVLGTDAFVSLARAASAAHGLPHLSVVLGSASDRRDRSGRWSSPRRRRSSTRSLRRPDP